MRGCIRTVWGGVHGQAGMWPHSNSALTSVLARDMADVVIQKMVSPQASVTQKKSLLATNFCTFSKTCVISPYSSCAVWEVTLPKRR